MMPTNTAAAKVEFTLLLLRLTRLVQEMGDRGLEPEAYGPARVLRPRYLQLFTQATRLAHAMGYADHESADYIGSLVVDYLRSSSRAERCQRMSLQQALGE